MKGIQKGHTKKGKSWHNDTIEPRKKAMKGIKKAIQKKAKAGTIMRSNREKKAMRT